MSLATAPTAKARFQPRSTSFLASRTDGRPPYSHAPALVTNANLVRLLRGCGLEVDPLGQHNTECGILYASACFLLKNGANLSAGVSSESLQRSWPVLEFTMAHMPNLTDIVLGGREAYESFRLPADLPVVRQRALDSKQPLEWNGYRLHVTTHTATRGINSRDDGSGRRAWDIVQEDWQRALPSPLFQ